MRLWIAGAARPFDARGKYTAPPHGVRKMKGNSSKILSEATTANAHRRLTS
jgi:hypothetical protein